MQWLKITKKALLGLSICLFPMVSQAQTRIVESDPCQYFTFEESKDVPSAEYVPNVDAYGRSVTPAEIGQGQAVITVPETVSFPLTIDLVESLSADLPDGTEMETTMGMVEVNTKTGKAIYNGKEITTGLEKYCKDIGLENDNKPLNNNEIIKEDIDVEEE